MYYDDTFQVDYAESSNTNRQYARNEAALASSGRANLILASSSQAVGSPHPSLALSDESVSDASSSSLVPNLKVVTKKNLKRRFDEMAKDRDSREDLKAGEEPTTSDSSSSSSWERVEKSLAYSRKRSTRGFKYRYRCDLCHENNEKHICDKEGDMKRHLQSLKHSQKSFSCTNPDCKKTFTREDALKRHKNSCRRRSSSLNRGRRRLRVS